MSVLYKIKDKRDVDWLEGSKSIRIRFHNDDYDNYYVDVPLEFITQHICTCGGYPDCICKKESDEDFGSSAGMLPGED